MILPQVHLRNVELGHQGTYPGAIQETRLYLKHDLREQVMPIAT